MFGKFLKAAIIGIVGTTVALYPMEKIEIKNDADAIRLMGAQMSNMRHMLEIYSLIGTGVTYKDPQKRLKETISNYEETIKRVEEKYKSDKFIRKSISRSKKAWVPLKEKLDKALSGKESQEKMKKGAMFVHDNMRHVIKEMEDMKGHFVEKSGTKNLKELNAALEIAASARRFSAHYMMKMWEIPDPTIEKHWNEGAKIFKTSLDTLSHSHFAKHPEFKKQLDIAKNSFSFLMTVSKFKDKYMPVAVQDKADKAYKAGINMAKYILTHIDNN